MSTRVEKGGPKFRPVLKSKPRIPPVVPVVSVDGRARPPLEEARISLSQPASTQEISLQELPSSHDVSHGSVLMPSNTSSEPNVASSPSKPSGIPIIISRTHVAITNNTIRESSTGQITDPSTSKTPPCNIQSSGDDRQDATTLLDSGVSQKQQKQTLVEAGKEKRSTKAATQAAAEEATNAEPVPAKERQKRKTAKETSNQDRPSKRRRSKSSSKEDSAQADAEDQSVDGGPQKKKRSKKTTTEDAESSAEPIDPTQITMRAICDDLGAGRKSSRWESSQTLYGEARKRAKEERARHILETEQQERETGRSSKKGGLKPPLPKEPLKGNGEHNEDQRDEFSYDETLKTSHYAPQVRIGANGEIVLDIDSLQVDRSADPDLIEEYSHIEENDHSKFTNSSSWSKRRLVRWGKEDTALFYDALRQFGQNFDLIARVLPGKTYRMCKNKFKAEDKKNPGLIDEALKNAVAVDLDTLSRMTGKNFEGPTPIITPRSTLTLGDVADPTTSQQLESNAIEIRSAETEDIDKQLNAEPTPIPETSALQDTFSTTRHSESPPPASSLLEMS